MPTGRREMPNLKKLIEVFTDARALLDREENDFMWSSWIDRESAVGEIDEVLARLRSGALPLMMGVLFAPTGPIQETSLSSGWGDAFIALADRFDSAMEDTAAEPSPACACLDSSASLDTIQELGLDRRYAEVSLLRCRICGRNWLRYLYENEGMTGSGRWYLGAVSDEQREVLNAESGKEVLEGLEWYRYGGSYYGGATGRTSGEILL